MISAARPWTVVMFSLLSGLFTQSPLFGDGNFWRQKRPWTACFEVKLWSILMLKSVSRFKEVVEGM